MAKERAEYRGSGFKTQFCPPGHVSWNISFTYSKTHFFSAIKGAYLYILCKVVGCKRLNGEILTEPLA